MKKTAVIFIVAVFIVTGLAVTASAFGPGWQNGPRPNYYGGHDRYRFDNGRHPVYHHQQVVYVPVHQPRPAVHVKEPVRPTVTIAVPRFSLWIR